MKKILLSVMTITLVTVVAIGATRAYFSDTETSQDNTFTAGAIDLKVDYESTYNGQNEESWSLTDLTPQHRFFDIADVKPGDEGEGTISLHVFDNDAFVYGQIIPKFDNDYSSNEPELETGDAPEDAANAWDGELGRNLSWKIWIDDGATDGWQGREDEGEGDNIWQQGEEVIAEGYASELGQSPTGWVYLGQLDSNETMYIGASWGIDLGVGNEVQTDRYQADISFLAVQDRHMAPGVLPSPVPSP